MSKPSAIIGSSAPPRRTHCDSDQGIRSRWTVEPIPAYAVADIGETGGKPPIGHIGNGDGDNRRHDPGEEGMQGAAMVNMAAALIAVVVSRGALVVLRVQVVMMHVQLGCIGERLCARQRRRHDAGELGGQEQRDQDADKVRYRSQPMHQSR
jgi:hypothetical protein